MTAPFPLQTRSLAEVEGSAKASMVTTAREAGTRGEQGPHLPSQESISVPAVAAPKKRRAKRTHLCGRSGCGQPVLLRGQTYCGKECADAAARVHYDARGQLPAPERRCESCGGPIRRRGYEGAAAYGKRRFCRLACANVASGEARTRCSGTVNSRGIECPGNWRIYHALNPTRSAGSLTEARARASIGDPNYAEIANLDTGQHLVRFPGGRWVETRSAGSPLLLTRAQPGADDDDGCEDAPGAEAAA